MSEEYSQVINVTVKIIKIAQYPKNYFPIEWMKKKKEKKMKTCIWNRPDKAATRWLHA